MCGIAGSFLFEPGARVDREALAAMTGVLAHRGPDADGFHVDGNVGLGHRRLSIIDLQTGDQPLSNEDGTVWVVFNGEIYNFAEIREDLERRGHVFRSHTDTEVIVHGYEEWGPAVVDRFRGMFAFAVWDAGARRLLLARDRLGIKPLYYSTLGGRGLAFGSEIKAVLEHPGVSREWRFDALDAYLALQYVPTPLTIFEDVRKLPPAHLLIAEDGKVRIERYWSLTFPGDGDSMREREYLERLDELLHEAVKLRLISDVPLGAFLSGGVDSSAVVAAMVDTSDAPVLTTSVGFNEERFNEVHYAERVARHLGCEHYTRRVTPDIVDLLPRLAWHLDEPFADASAVPTYYVSAVARERVTVALSGDGGDELWAGYARHRVERLEGQARRWLGRTGAGAASRVGRMLPLGVKGARSLRHLGMPPAEACAQKHVYGLFEHGVRDRLYTPEFASMVREHDPLSTLRTIYERCSSPDPVDRSLFVDVQTYLLDDILTKVDKMSMAVSLETRVPLLDHKLVEFAAAVPAGLKLRGGRTKHLLRRFLDKRIPADILERPKHGFEAPTGEWLRGPLAPMAGDLLLGPTFRTRGVFSPAAVARLWSEHQSGRRDHRHRLWSLLMLELWFRQFVDQPAQQARATA
jgi:asparagine synthase (glutamine-hydrolysing)